MTDSKDRHERASTILTVEHTMSPASGNLRDIEEIELETVTSYFAMEAIEEQRPIPM